MDIETYLNEVSYLFPKHIKTTAQLHEDVEAREVEMVFFDVRGVSDSPDWHEFLMDTFDYGDFQSQLFEGEQWDLSKTLPLALVGMSQADFDPAGEEVDDPGQLEGILIVELSGDTVDSCPLSIVGIDGTATDDPPDAVRLSIRELFDSREG